MGALGNRATKTAKNIRRKSRRKPRKYRTPINTRKRLGRGYGFWRHNMATRPNNESRIPTNEVGNEILATLRRSIYKNDYEDIKEPIEREHVDINQFVDDIASLEQEYHNMSNWNRQATREIEYQILTGKKRMPRTQTAEDYTKKFIIVRDTWYRMSNDKKDAAFKLYDTKYQKPIRYYIRDGPCDRTFGEFMERRRLP